jgi:hypothetical protein
MTMRQMSLAQNSRTVSIPSRNAFTPNEIAIFSALNFGALLAPFGGYNYDASGLIQPLSFACLLALYVSLLIRSPARAGDSLRTIGIPLLGIFGCAYIWSLIFAVNFDTDILPSLLSCRWWIYYLEAPIILMMYRGGCDTNTILRPIVISGCCVFLYWAYCYHTWDLEKIASDVNPEVRRLSRADAGLRGYRLIYPQYLFVFLLFYLGFSFRDKTAGLWKKVIFLFLLFEWSLVYSRLATIIMAISIIFYLAVVRRRTSSPTRLLFFIAALAVAAALITYIPVIMDFAQNDYSGIARLRTMDILIGNLGDHLVLGGGQASFQGLSYQSIYGAFFFPEDLGVMGILFRYGLIGTAIYLFLASAVAKSSFDALRAGTFGAFAPAAVCMAIFSLLAMPTFPVFITNDSIPVSAILIGFGMIAATTQRVPPAKANPRRD